MNSNLVGLSLMHNNIGEALTDATSANMAPPSLLTNSINDRNNIKTYGQWVNTKFAPAGVLTKVTAKLMTPFCGNPVVGIIILCIFIGFAIWLTWYVTNGKCNDLTDDKLKRIAELISTEELKRIGALGFKSDIDKNMVNEQSMFSKMGDIDKLSYLMMPTADKLKKFNQYITNIK